MFNLLAKVIENGKEITRIGLGEAALYALIGQVVVFVGIAFLVLIVWAVGLAFKRLPGKPDKKEKSVPVETIVNESVPNSNELDAETIAVITAAIAAYYEEQQIPCEFVIKKIKRK